MISYRQQLAKIGYQPNEFVSYRSFFLAPHSLRETLCSMDFPRDFSEVIPGDEIGEDWTEEVQGCAFAHGRWFLVSNRSGAPRLHVFEGLDFPKVQVKSWDLRGVPPPNPSLPGFQFNHFGAILISGDEIFIDHWYNNSGQILVLQGDGASIYFSRWINLANPDGRVGMIAINFERRKIVTAGGGLNIDRVYLHSLDTGEYEDKMLMLNPGIHDQCYAQGGFWSPNNHLYISSGEGHFLESAKGHQYIYCYSPLNGRLLNRIGVPSEEGSQELEGCSYAAVVRNGRQVYVHAVLLANRIFTDNIFLKSFSADRPELI